MDSDDISQDVGLLNESKQKAGWAATQPRAHKQFHQRMLKEE